MPDKVTSVMGDHFSTVNITHKPKRLQSDNIRASQDEEDDTSPDIALAKSVSHGATLEKAIKFFESNATGDLRALYTATAKWLREYQAVGQHVIRKALSEISEKSGETKNEDTTKETET